MRTVEVPDELFDQVQRAAAARGLSVVEYLGRKVAEDVRSEPPPSPTGYRANFPLIRSNVPGPFQVTKELLDDVELDDDVRRSGLLGYE